MLFGFNIVRKLLGRKSSRGNEISPDEIFLDSKNLPEFDRDQFEGRLEKSIPKRNLIAGYALFLIIAVVFVGKLWSLEIKNGEVYANRSENNRLDHTLVFSDRGVIYDRNRTPLAWNVINVDNPDFSSRKYIETPGFSNLLGYIKYPTKDTSGFYFREDFVGMAGVESFFNTDLQGENGIKLIETDARGQVQSEGVLRPPENGKSLTLSIDSKVQGALYTYIAELAHNSGFVGGAGIIMDVTTGEVLAQVNYPEYNSQILTEGSDRASINQYLADKNNPFLDRITDGLYTPGSIIKPFVAMGALSEGIISPEKSILSTGSISIPNPYFPDLPTVFKDWKAHGYVNMRQAIAVSSDVYFYAVGGGYQDQKGLGIANIEKYARMFGFGQAVESPFYEGNKGVIPSPEWKKANFNGEAWTLGNTYHTSIGQYGFQVTPAQVVRAVGALATAGTMVDPHIVFGESTAKKAKTVDLAKSDFTIVQEGMRQSVLNGTASALNLPYVNVAGKTGTAELGVSKDFVNSWTVGYFPYENPRYAYAVIMERGPRTNTVGASYVMRQLVDWMHVYTPEYLK